MFLVDDHPAVRRGLALLLTREADLEICGEADNGPSALKQLIALEPDLGIIDLTLKESDGVKLIKELRAHCPDLKLVVFSMHNQASHIEAALRAGANGYVAKEEGTERLVEAIRAVIGGQRFLTVPMQARLAEATVRLPAAGDHPSSEP